MIITQLRLPHIWQWLVVDAQKRQHDMLHCHNNKNKKTIMIMKQIQLMHIWKRLAACAQQYQQYMLHYYNKRNNYDSESTTITA